MYVHVLKFKDGGEQILKAKNQGVYIGNEYMISGLIFSGEASNSVNMFFDCSTLVEVVVVTE